MKAKLEVVLLFCNNDCRQIVYFVLFFIKKKISIILKNAYLIIVLSENNNLFVLTEGYLIILSFIALGII